MKIRLLLHSTEKGQGTVQYAMGVIAIVAIIIAVLFKSKSPLATAVNSAYNKMANKTASIPTKIGASSSPVSSS